MRLEANAKINIGLLVGDRRPDGYHSIETIMARISLSDAIEAVAEPAGRFSVSIEGNEGYVGGGADLMEKAARAFFCGSGIPFSLRIAIDKRIPVGAGFGGGSSDAAEILRYLSACFPSAFDGPSLLSLAASVGSDVPFFVSGLSGAFVAGRGDAIRPASVPHRSRVLLFIPEERVATEGAYSALDSMARPLRHLPPLDHGFPTRASHPNDFELLLGGIPAFIPHDIVSSGAYVSMTGSGSAWFAILRGEEDVKFDNLEKYGIVSEYII